MPSDQPAAPIGSGRLRLIVFILVGLFLLLRLFAGAWAEWSWFGSVGFTDVWWTLVGNSAFLVVVTAIAAIALLWGNIALAARLSPGIVMVPDEDGQRPLAVWMQPRVRRLFVLMAVAFGVLNGFGATAWTQHFLYFRNAQDFGTNDPVFGLDVGFYIFQLPFIQDLLGWSFQILVLTFLVAAAVHYLSGGFRVIPGSEFEVDQRAKNHLSIILAVLMLTRALDYWIDTYGLLIEDRAGEVVFGAGATDIDIRIPAYRLLALIAVFTAVILIVNLWRRGWALPVVSIGLWVGIAIVAGSIVPSLYQRFRVTPNEQVLEQQYVERQIEFTRQAFGLGDVEVRSFDGTPALEAADIEANRPTIDNIRVWDPRILRVTFQQQQAIRTYYEIADVDVDRYTIDGETTQVMLASREVDAEGLPSQGWIIENLQYTHGFGAVMSAANAVDQGRPSYLVDDVPPVAADPIVELQEDGSRIYFGDSYDPDSFLVVGTLQDEVDYPIGSEGQSFQPYNYDGEGGVEVGGVFTRMLLALRYSDVNVLISPQIEPESKILMKRNIRQRVSEVVPFLRLDSDPYLAIVDGRLVWIVDLYSESDSFPYSRNAIIDRLPFQTTLAANLPNSFNYIRNAAKATVDAENGDVTVYVVDDTDPIVKAQRQIFPDVFVPMDEMPDGVRDHIRYPEDLFRVQSDMFAEFHVTDPQAFYLSDDAWAIPPDPSEINVQGQTTQVLRGDVFNPTAADPMVPYYLLMALPEEDEESYLIMQPFNPAERPVMSAFLVAKSDPEEYGELIVFRLPRGASVSGPDQVATLIQQDPDVSAQITLWSQQGSRVDRGNLLVIPVEESLLYVQPLYLSGEQAPFPEMERVVVAYGDQIVMEPTLEQALVRLFGDLSGTVDPGDEPVDDEEPSDPADEPTDEVVGELADVVALFEEADAALQAGDLGEYQAKVEEARALLEALLAQQP
jgi:uncharacterized membrane protein (UPF0182 family)